MQLIITDSRWIKSRAIHLKPGSLLLLTVVLSTLLMLCAAGLYHWVFLKGAREGWPVISTLVRFVVRDEFAQRDRFMRENIDLLAQRLGEMQAKLLQLESLGERVSSLAGIHGPSLQRQTAQGGRLVADRSLSLDELTRILGEVDALTAERTAALTQLESQLFEKKLKGLLAPTQSPLDGALLGSVFGWRIDPITGRSALHTGLDFPAAVGTPVRAAAGGVVIVQEFQSEYGNVVEIDHGNDLVSRYAHNSKVAVKRGDLVKRGQIIGAVGSTGRSTGPHLHFEVLVNGIPQDPQKFLNAGQRVAERTRESSQRVTSAQAIREPLRGESSR